MLIFPITKWSRGLHWLRYIDSPNYSFHLLCRKFGQMCRQNWVFSSRNWYRGSQEDITFYDFSICIIKSPSLTSPQRFRTKLSRYSNKWFSKLRRKLSRFFGVCWWSAAARLTCHGQNTNAPQPLIFSYLTFRLSGIYIQPVLGKGLKCTKTVCKYICQSGNPQQSWQSREHGQQSPLAPFM